MYALFRNGIQISKGHATKEVAIIEAYEYGAIIDVSADFVGERDYRLLAGGYEIRYLEE